MTRFFILFFFARRTLVASPFHPRGARRGRSHAKAEARESTAILPRQAISLKPHPFPFHLACHTSLFRFPLPFLASSDFFKPQLLFFFSFSDSSRPTSDISHVGPARTGHAKSRRRAKAAVTSASCPRRPHRFFPAFFFFFLLAFSRSHPFEFYFIFSSSPQTECVFSPRWKSHQADPS